MTDRYEDLLELADLLDAVGLGMRSRAGLGEQVLGDPSVADSAELAPTTFERFDEDVRAATTGQHGLLARSAEVDADALAVRASVSTHRWVEGLRASAARTFGAIAGRAVGYRAPQVALGGAVVSAGLIETDVLERDDVAAYLDELVAANPELLEHAAGGDGLLAGLHLRSLVTTGPTSSAAARAGLHEVGPEPFDTDLGPALRDVAAPVVDDPPPSAAVTGDDGQFSGIGDLVAAAATASAPVSVHEVGPSRYVVLLPGPDAGPGPVRLVVGDHTSYADQAAAAITELVGAGASVLLVGWGPGGAAAVDVAARPGSFSVDQVVTAGAPAAPVPALSRRVRVLALEDRADPVTLLGRPGAPGAEHRLTVVFDGDGEAGPASYVAGGRAVDAADHPRLRRELERLRRLGYLR